MLSLDLYHFSRLGIEKIKDEVIDKPKIRILTKNENFVNSMNGIESVAYNSLVIVADSFF